ncbi:MAG: protein-methionine-sulfoxide reductase catalytic subunit MsrP [SAR324 cluster bacterium]|nr:protein-methionine-sulfoxide reductase catalytic subunit MsrP [SAR324 cluster bacterium]
MKIIKKPDWAIPESQVTPQADYLTRRKLLKAAGFGSALLLGTPYDTMAQAFESIQGGDKITPKKLVKTYNNFYEFSEKKEDVHRLTGNFNTSGWKIKIGGLVEKELTLDMDDIKRLFPVEQRIYKFRCVEAWAMTVPWGGFSLAKLVAHAKPLSGAQHVEFKSFYRPKEAPGQATSYYSWPYSEGLSLAEATNDLAFLSTGIYGEDLPKQNGAPIRLVTPWKYGFKSIKSIVEINFVKKQPDTLWNQLAPREYGYYANVNPNVDHPRWSQKSHKVLGEWFKREPTKIFNGYEAQVGDLYKGWDLSKLY